MATIYAFPPEIINHTLSFAPDCLETRNSFLYNTSLVQRSWRDESQHLLWSQLYIARKSRLQKLLRSPLLGQFQTRTLWVNGEKLSPRMVIDLASKLVGLKKMRLVKFDWHSELDYEIFCLPNLQEVKTLELWECCHTISNPWRHSQPSFSLDHLRLEHMAEPSRFPNPFSFFSSPSLSSLTLSLYPEQDSIYYAPQTRDVANLFESNGAGLVDLTIRLPVPPFFLPSLEVCSNLRSLTIKSSEPPHMLEIEQVEEVFQAFHPTNKLATLTLCKMTNDQIVEILMAILASPKMKSLKKVNFMGNYVPERAPLKGRDFLLGGACRERGLEIDFVPEARNFGRDLEDHSGVLHGTGMW